MRLFRNFFSVLLPVSTIITLTLSGLCSSMAYAEEHVYRLITEPDYGRMHVLDVFIDGKAVVNQSQYENALYSFKVVEGQRLLEVIGKIDAAQEYYGCLLLDSRRKQMGHDIADRDVFMTLKERVIRPIFPVSSGKSQSPCQSARGSALATAYDADVSWSNERHQMLLTKKQKINKKAETHHNTADISSLKPSVVAQLAVRDRKSSAESGQKKRAVDKQIQRTLEHYKAKNKALRKQLKNKTRILLQQKKLLANKQASRQQTRAVLADKKKKNLAAKTTPFSFSTQTRLLALNENDHDNTFSNRVSIAPKPSQSSNKARSISQTLLPKMVKIPSGEFTMGCQHKNRCPNEKIGTTTTRMPTFYLSATEITFQQWDVCYKEGRCPFAKDVKNWGRKHRPVINVSWQDAQKYIAWLSEKTSKQYRLPMEREWEYAARSGKSTPFSTGHCITDKQANFNRNLTNIFSFECGKNASIYHKKTLPVATFLSNNYGLYDMHGNVWEWVQDCWLDDEVITTTKYQVNTCKLKILRGGAWHSPMSNLRASYRFRYQQDTRSFDVGFRVAIDKP